ncbi:unnamed protein product, partial [Hymenolepis diminuta]|uniref:Protein kinase domain-containing protein n=1 Tax=Hymenolepis diminuta TaxID=6216 RepID=A0A0R3SJ30_HYMDI
MALRRTIKDRGTSPIPKLDGLSLSIATDFAEPRIFPLVVDNIHAPSISRSYRTKSTATMCALHLEKERGMRDDFIVAEQVSMMSIQATDKYEESYLLVTDVGKSAIKGKCIQTTKVAACDTGDVSTEFFGVDELMHSRESSAREERETRLFDLETQVSPVLVAEECQTEIGMGRNVRESATLTHDRRAAVDMNTQALDNNELIRLSFESFDSTSVLRRLDIDDHNHFTTVSSLVEFEENGRSLNSDNGLKAFSDYVISMDRSRLTRDCGVNTVPEKKEFNLELQISPTLVSDESQTCLIDIKPSFLSFTLNLQSPLFTYDLVSTASSTSTVLNYSRSSDYASALGEVISQTSTVFDSLDHCTSFHNISSSNSLFMQGRSIQLSLTHLNGINTGLVLFSDSSWKRRTGLLFDSETHMTPLGKYWSDFDVVYSYDSFRDDDQCSTSSKINPLGGSMHISTASMREAEISKEDSIVCSKCGSKLTSKEKKDCSDAAVQVQCNQPSSNMLDSPNIKKIGELFDHGDVFFEHEGHFEIKQPILTRHENKEFQTLSFNSRNIVSKAISCSPERKDIDVQYSPHHSKSIEIIALTVEGDNACSEINPIIEKSSVSIASSGNQFQNDLSVLAQNILPKETVFNDKSTLPQSVMLKWTNTASMTSKILTNNLIKPILFEDKDYTAFIRHRDENIAGIQLEWNSSSLQKLTSDLDCQTEWIVVVIGWQSMDKVSENVRRTASLPQSTIKSCSTAVATGLPVIKSKIFNPDGRSCKVDNAARHQPFVRKLKNKNIMTETKKSELKPQMSFTSYLSRSNEDAPISIIPDFTLDRQSSSEVEEPELIKGFSSMHYSLISTASTTVKQLMTFKNKRDDILSFDGADESEKSLVIPSRSSHVVNISVENSRKTKDIGIEAVIDSNLSAGKTQTLHDLSITEAELENAQFVPANAAHVLIHTGISTAIQCILIGTDTHPVSRVHNQSQTESAADETKLDLDIADVKIRTSLEVADFECQASPNEGTGIERSIEVINSTDVHSTLINSPDNEMIFTSVMSSNVISQKFENELVVIADKPKTANQESETSQNLPKRKNKNLMVKPPDEVSRISKVLKDTATGPETVPSFDTISEQKREFVTSIIPAYSKNTSASTRTIVSMISSDQLVKSVTKHSKELSDISPYSPPSPSVPPKDGNDGSDSDSDSHNPPYMNMETDTKRPMHFEHSMSTRTNVKMVTAQTQSEHISNDNHCQTESVKILRVNEEKDVTEASGNKPICNAAPGFYRLISTASMASVEVQEQISYGVKWERSAALLTQMGSLTPEQFEAKGNQNIKMISESIAATAEMNVQQRVSETNTNEVGKGMRKISKKVEVHPFSVCAECQTSIETSEQGLESAQGAGDVYADFKIDEGTFSRSGCSVLDKSVKTSHKIRNSGTDAVPEFQPSIAKVRMKMVFAQTQTELNPIPSRHEDISLVDASRSQPIRSDPSKSHQMLSTASMSSFSIQGNIMMILMSKKPTICAAIQVQIEDLNSDIVLESMVVCVKNNVQENSSMSQGKMTKSKKTQILPTLICKESQTFTESKESNEGSTSPLTEDSGDVYANFDFNDLAHNEGTQNTYFLDPLPKDLKGVSTSSIARDKVKNPQMVTEQDIEGTKCQSETTQKILIQKDSLTRDMGISCLLLTSILTNVESKHIQKIKSEGLTISSLMEIPSSHPIKDISTSTCSMVGLPSSEPWAKSSIVSSSSVSYQQNDDDSKSEDQNLLSFDNETDTNTLRHVEHSAGPLSTQFGNKPIGTQGQTNFINIPLAPSEISRSFLVRGASARSINLISTSSMSSLIVKDVSASWTFSGCNAGQTFLVYTSLPIESKPYVDIVTESVVSSIQENVQEPSASTKTQDKNMIPKKIQVHPFTFCAESQTSVEGDAGDVCVDFAIKEELVTPGSSSDVNKSPRTSPSIKESRTDATLETKFSVALSQTSSFPSTSMSALPIEASVTNAAFKHTCSVPIQTISQPVCNQISTGIQCLALMQSSRPLETAVKNIPNSHRNSVVLKPLVCSHIQTQSFVDALSLNSVKAIETTDEEIQAISTTSQSECQTTMTSSSNLTEIGHKIPEDTTESVVDVHSIPLNSEKNKPDSKRDTASTSVMSSIPIQQRIPIRELTTKTENSQKKLRIENTPLLVISPQEFLLSSKVLTGTTTEIKDFVNETSNPDQDTCLSIRTRLKSQTPDSQGHGSLSLLLVHSSSSPPQYNSDDSDSEFKKKMEKKTTKYIKRSKSPKSPQIPKLKKSRITPNCIDSNSQTDTFDILPTDGDNDSIIVIKSEPISSGPLKPKKLIPTASMSPLSIYENRVQEISYRKYSSCAAVQTVIGNIFSKSPDDEKDRSVEYVIPSVETDVQESVQKSNLSIVGRMRKAYSKKVQVNPFTFYIESQTALEVKDERSEVGSDETGHIYTDFTSSDFVSDHSSKSIDRQINSNTQSSDSFSQTSYHMLPVETRKQDKFEAKDTIEQDVSENLFASTIPAVKLKTTSTMSCYQVPRLNAERAKLKSLIDSKTQHDTVSEISKPDFSLYPDSVKEFLSEIGTPSSNTFAFCLDSLFFPNPPKEYKCASTMTQNQIRDTFMSTFTKTVLDTNTDDLTETEAPYHQVQLTDILGSISKDKQDIGISCHFLTPDSTINTEQLQESEKQSASLRSTGLQVITYMDPYEDRDLGYTPANFESENYMAIFRPQKVHIAIGRLENEQLDHAKVEFVPQCDNIVRETCQTVQIPPALTLMYTSTSTRTHLQESLRRDSISESKTQLSHEEHFAGNQFEKVKIKPAESTVESCPSGALRPQTNYSATMTSMIVAPSKNHPITAVKSTVEKVEDFRVVVNVSTQTHHEFHSPERSFDVVGTSSKLSIEQKMTEDSTSEIEVGLVAKEFPLDHVPYERGSFFEELRHQNVSTMTGVDVRRTDVHDSQLLPKSSEKERLPDKVETILDEHLCMRCQMAIKNVESSQKGEKISSSTQTQVSVEVLTREYEQISTKAKCIGIGSTLKVMNAGTSTLLDTIKPEAKFSVITNKTEIHSSHLRSVVGDEIFEKENSDLQAMANSMEASSSMHAGSVSVKILQEAPEVYASAESTPSHTSSKENSVSTAVMSSKLISQISSHIRSKKSIFVNQGVMVNTYLEGTIKSVIRSNVNTSASTEIGINPHKSQMKSPNIHSEESNEIYLPTPPSSPPPPQNSPSVDSEDMNNSVLVFVTSSKADIRKHNTKTKSSVEPILFDKQCQTESVKILPITEGLCFAEESRDTEPKNSSHKSQHSILTQDTETQTIEVIGFTAECSTVETQTQYLSKNAKCQTYDDNFSAVEPELKFKEIFENHLEPLVTSAVHSLPLETENDMTVKNSAKINAISISIQTETKHISNNEAIGISTINEVQEMDDPNVKIDKSKNYPSNEDTQKPKRYKVVTSSISALLQSFTRKITKPKLINAETQATSLDINLGEKSNKEIQVSSSTESTAKQPIRTECNRTEKETSVETNSETISSADDDLPHGFINTGTGDSESTFSYQLIDEGVQSANLASNALTQTSYSLLP